MFLIDTSIQCVVKLSWLESDYSRSLDGVLFAILTSRVCQTGLVFSVSSGFTSRSVHARLQVSVCSSYDLCHPGLPSRHTHTHRQQFDKLIWITQLAELKTLSSVHTAKCSLTHTHTHTQLAHMMHQKPEYWVYWGRKVITNSKTCCHCATVRRKCSGLVDTQYNTVVS